jgi:hypothetical protein
LRFVGARLRSGDGLRLNLCRALARRDHCDRRRHYRLAVPVSDRRCFQRGRLLRLSSATGTKTWLALLLLAAIVRRAAAIAVLGAAIAKLAALTRKAKVSSAAGRSADLEGGDDGQNREGKK